MDQPIFCYRKHQNHLDPNEKLEICSPNDTLHPNTLLWHVLLRETLNLKCEVGPLRFEIANQCFAPGNPKIIFKKYIIRVLVYAVWHHMQCGIIY